MSNNEGWIPHDGDDLPRDLGEYNGIAWRPHKNADGQAGQEGTTAPSQEGHAAGPACSAPKEEHPNIGWCPVCEAPRIEIGIGCAKCNNHLLKIDRPTSAAPDEALIEYVCEYLTNLCRENWLSPREIADIAICEYIRRSAGKEKG